MKPLNTEHTTIILGAPKDWDADAYGQCEGLPVLIEREGSHMTFFSYWRATWRERAAILFGRPIRLCVTGQAHPPVHLDTERH